MIGDGNPDAQPLGALGNFFHAVDAIGIATMKMQVHHGMIFGQLDQIRLFELNSIEIFHVFGGRQAMETFHRDPT